MILAGSTKKAVMRVKDRMRLGSSLMKMHTTTGAKWYVVPGREVDGDVALKVIAEPDVVPCNDALFPGISQTYMIKTDAKSQAADEE